MIDRGTAHATLYRRGKAVRRFPVGRRRPEHARQAAGNADITRLVRLMPIGTPVRIR